VTYARKWKPLASGIFVGKYYNLEPISYLPVPIEFNTSSLAVTTRMFFGEQSPAAWFWIRGDISIAQLDALGVKHGEPIPRLL
jgi:hypothetical protein